MTRARAIQAEALLALVILAALVLSIPFGYIGPAESPSQLDPAFYDDSDWDGLVYPLTDANPSAGQPDVVIVKPVPRTAAQRSSSPVADRFIPAVHAMRGPPR